MGESMLILEQSIPHGYQWFNLTIIFINHGNFVLPCLLFPFPSIISPIHGKTASFEILDKPINKFPKTREIDSFSVIQYMNDVRK